MIRIHAPAKVNLSLRVLSRESSGFHQLETLFAALEFSDLISFSLRGSGISLSLDGPHLGPPEENLVYRAAKGFRELTGVDEGLEIHLEKRIPVQAGLGGGSSDAAATLRALDFLFPGRIGEGALLELASSLGADVPFFMGPSSLALAWGRGDRLLSFPALPKAPVLLAIPPQGLSTPEAYGLLARARETESPNRGPALLALESFADWEGVQSSVENDFEDVLFPAFPFLARLREALEETGPRFSLLSGSGSALFAVYRAQEEAREAKASLRATFPDTRFFETQTLESMPDPISMAGVEG